MQGHSLLQRFVAEPHYDETHTVRIKATCLRCDEWQIGNAEDIVRWEAEHRCALGPSAFSDECRRSRAPLGVDEEALGNWQDGEAKAA